MTVAAPGPGEVRVRVMASGVCHTDLAAVRDARVWPVVLGHEGAGVVESVGDGVSRVAVGDHVVVNWQPRCGSCRACVGGRAACCTGIRGTAEPRLHLGGEPLTAFLHAGTFAPLAVVPEAGAVPIRSDVPFRIAALLGCAVATGVGATVRCAQVRDGDAVVVIGVGGVGLNVVQGARMCGANAIVAVDVDPAHLDLAMRLGATHCVNPADGDAAAAVHDVMAAGADHVFEVVGSVTTMTSGLAMLARGGTLTLVGAAARDAELSFHPRAFMSNQQRIAGCIYGEILPDVDLPAYADSYAAGDLKLDELLTGTTTLDAVPGMFATPPTGIRTVVTMEDLLP